MSLADIVEPLQQPLFTVLDTPVSWTEVVGFGSGALGVWLVTRRHLAHLANRPIGIADNLFFILLLQIVFIALAAYGWWTWTHGGGPGLDGLPVRGTTRTEWTWLLAAGVVGIFCWDALTTALSLLATYGQIAAGVVHVPLHAYKELYLTSLLRIGFMALCVVGLRTWSCDPVRAALARRVVVLGAESTGTTTMARSLAELRARRPGARWDEIAFTSQGHERYPGGPNEEVARIAARFEDDGLRDGEHLRPWTTARFQERPARTGRRTVVRTGPHEQRLAAAAVDALLDRGRDLAGPLPERR